MRIPDAEAWIIFATVAEQRSFSGAGIALGLSKATISKIVTRLERSLETPLFNRTSRRLALTPSGERLIAHARRIRAECEAAEEAARDAAIGPSGLVRLAAPMSFGIGKVAPLLADFLAAYPGLQVDVHLSDAQVDVIGGGFDLALRIAQLPDSSLRARQLCAVRLHTLASPAYVARHGSPRHPVELGEHRCIGYTLSRNPEIWRYTAADGSEAAVRPAGPLRVNNGDAMLPALCAGLGIGQLPDFICAAELAAGRLIALLPDWSPPPLALHLVSPPGVIRARRVQLLADFLAERLSS